ncbi:MAG: hypothetical protein EA340_01825 [Nitriliruptor sp.]|nr:MAG: hypothetical protein EA340_01825 [Nitriliruptor sp.]
MKRAFTLALGLGAGVVVGIYLVRRLDDAQRAVQPSNLAGNAGRAAAGFTARLQDAVAEGRLAAAEREAELRRQFDVPSLRNSLGD